MAAEALVQIGNLLSGFLEEVFHSPLFLENKFTKMKNKEITFLGGK